jgi:hypothetical protein
MDHARQFIGAAEIAELMGSAFALRPAELFRPYVYRDPSRADGERMAELKAIDLAECFRCRFSGWPCEEHRPRELGLTA